MLTRKISIISLAILCGCCTQQEPAEFDTAALFGADGCLTPDMVHGYSEEIPCLDKDKDGCVTRAEWDDFMDYWRTHVPESGQPLCRQMNAVRG